MIQMQTLLKVADNTGARELMCIRVLGGTGRKMPEILQVVRAKNPKARVCISAIALETLHQAVEELTVLGHAPEITQISVSRAKAAGDLHLLLAQNPIFLLSAGGDA